MKRPALECVLVVVILLIAAQIFHPADTGSRHYFSPDSLQSRYRTDEWLFGLVPIYYAGFRDKSSPLADYLVQNGYWTPTGASESRWLQTGYFSAQWRDGQSWLHRVLYWEDEEWIAWTETKPQLARFVWPQFLASLRRQESESEAIEFLFLVRHATSVEELRQLVHDSEELGDELKRSIATAVE